MGNNTRTVLINTIMLTASSLLLNTVGVSFNVYISNKIGTELLGVYHLLLSAYTFALTLAISGIGLASTRLTAEELAFGREEGARAAVRRCIIYALIFGLLSAFLLSVNAELISTRILKNPLTTMPLYALSVTLPFVSVSAVIQGYFTAKRKVVKNISAQMLEQFTRMTVIIYLFGLLLPEGNACFAIALGGMVSEMCSLLYSYILYKSEKRLPKTGNESGLTNRMLAIAVPVALSSYIRSGLNSIKNIITPASLQKGGISGKESLSAYGAVQGMAFPIIMFPACLLNAFTSLLIPEIARFHASKNYRRIHQVIDYIFKITLLFSVCVSGNLLFFGSELGSLIYKNADVSIYIKALAFVVPIIYFDAIVDGLLKGLNQQVSVVRINIADTAVTIALILLILPRYGITGYIIVIYISEIFNAYLSIRKLFKITGNSIHVGQWIIKPLICIFASCLLSGLVSGGVVIKIILSAVMYVTMLFILGVLNKDDFQILLTRKA